MSIIFNSSFAQDIVLLEGESKIVDGKKISCSKDLRDDSNACGRYLQLSSKELISTLAVGIGKCYARSTSHPVVRGTDYVCRVFDISGKIVYQAFADCEVLAKMIKVEMKDGSFEKTCGCE